MLLLLFAGAKSSKVVTKCCFQPSAFQNNAFQNCGGKVVGWMPEWGFQHDPAELERRLASQKSDRKWFEEFIAAATAARQRADKTKSDKQRRALIYAAEAAVDKVAEAIGQESEAPLAIIAALQAAATASRITASIKHAELVIELAREWEDEEDILMLLQ